MFARLGVKADKTSSAFLRKNKSELRRAISKNLSLKFTPDLRFRLDETFDRMDETRRLFSQDDVLRDLDET
jgi:ribosome-binding factor A